MVRSSSSLLGRVPPEQRVAQLAVHRLDGPHHALAAIDACGRRRAARSPPARRSRRPTAPPRGRARRRPSATSTSTVGLPRLSRIWRPRIATISVSVMVRLPDRSNRMLLAQPVEGDQHVQQRRQLGERHHVRAVARRPVGIGMGLDEHRGDADRHGGARQHRHELALAAAGAAQAARLLHRMGGVEHDRPAGAAPSAAARANPTPACCSRSCVPRSPSMMRRAPNCSSFFATCAMSQGARNWPFLTCTAAPVAPPRPADRSGGTGTPGSAERRPPRPPAGTAGSRARRSAPGSHSARAPRPAPRCPCARPRPRGLSALVRFALSNELL